MEQTWEDALTKLKVGTSRGKPAVHKPLLVLMLVARAQAGKSNTVSFREIAGDLEAAIQELGPSVKKANAALPFWHLQSDGFWRVMEREALAGSDGKLTKKGLGRSDATGEVDPRAWKQLTTNPDMAKRVARKIIDKYWPKDQQKRVADRVGVRI